MSDAVEDAALFDLEAGEAEAERLRLLVHFSTRADRQAFAERVGQRIGSGAQSIHYPAAGKLPQEFLKPVAEGIDAEQHDLFEMKPRWADAWRGMPAYAHQDLTPWQTIEVYFERERDRLDFARLLGVAVTDETKSVWFPPVETDKVINLRWRSTRPLNPRYPVYVPTKGRWDSAFTIKCLERLGIPYHAVVQPQEREHYAQVVKSGTMLLLPEGLDGLVPTRNWIMEHSIAQGAERHWQLDDNIKSFFRYHENRQIRVADGTCMRIGEDFADRYENVAIAGFQYFMFVPRKHDDFPPYVFNTRVYSNSLINNKIPFRYRDVYNDDTDICLRALKAGWCTVQYNMFLAWKQPTMRVKGGNTPIYLGAEEVRARWVEHVAKCSRCELDVSPTCEEGRTILSKDGRWRMADSLVRQHPDVTTIYRRWGRWQHYVDYRRFKGNVPILKQDLVIPEGTDDYGLELVQVAPEGVRQPTPEGDATAAARPAARPAAPTPEPRSGMNLSEALEALLGSGSQEAAPAVAPGGQEEALPEPLSPASSLPAEPPSPSRAELLKADLEARGHRLFNKEGKLNVGAVAGADALTDADRALLKEHKAELLRLATIVEAPPLVVVPYSQARVEGSLASFLGNEPPRADPSYVQDEFPNLDGIDDVTLNFECTGYRWWADDVPIGVTVGTLDGKVSRFLPWGFAGNNLPKERVLEFLREKIRGKRITNANTRFEVHMGRKVGVDLEEQGCTVADVQIDAALLDDNRRKFNVDLLAEEFLGGVMVPRVDESRMPSYDASEVAARARYQVQLVSELHAYMWPKIVAEGLEKVRQLECDVIYPVCEMEQNGAPIDVERLDRWVKESHLEYEQILLELMKETGRSINPNAPSDLEKLFEHLNLPIARLDSGAPSFTDAILKRIKHPLIQRLRFAVKLSDLRSRYLLNWQRRVGSDGILRYALHQTRYQKDTGEEGGTGPGRFSSAELDPDVGINIQQAIKITKQRKMFGHAEDDSSHDDEIYLIRKLVIPDRKFDTDRWKVKWLCADAEQIEYRIFVDYTRSRRIIAEYEKNPRLNFHKLIEQMMKGQGVAMDYDGAKTYNFATIYGAAQVKRSVMLGFITEEEGNEIRERKAWNDPRLAPLKAIDAAYNRLVPEVKPLLERAQKLAETRGYVMTRMGRRSRFWRAVPDGQRVVLDNRYHKAFNNIDQGTAADYNKVKLVEVHRERKHTGFVMRFTVHDEMDGDAREPDTLAKVREILDRQSWPDMKVQLLWDANLGDNWAEAK